MTALDVIADSILKDENYSEICQLIKKGLRVESLAPLIYSIYTSDYQNRDSLEVFRNLKNNRRRKMGRWHDNAIEGYENYKNGEPARRGFYSHLVEHHKALLALHKTSGSSFLKKSFNVNSVEELMHQFIQDIGKWKETEAYFVEYPFIDKLSDKAKKTALEDDLAVIVGEWLSINKKPTTPYLPHEVQEVQDVSDSSFDVFAQTPMSSIDSPLFSSSNRVEYKIDDTEYNLISLERKFSHELPNEIQMGYEEIPYEQFKLKPPDLKDSKIFDLLLNYRDISFQNNRKIFAYLSDIRKEVYESDSSKNTNELKERLFRLGLFKLIEFGENNSFQIKGLFSGMKVQEDNMGQWYVEAVVSEHIYNNIIKQQLIKIYDGKIKKLENLMAYRLAFIIHRKRIDLHDSNLDRVRFHLNWKELNRSIIFNKRYKSQNMSDIADALMELKEKGFLIEDFERYKSDSFYLTCYPLSESELKVINTEKLTLEDSGFEGILLEQEQGD